MIREYLRSFNLDYVALQETHLTLFDSHPLDELGYFKIVTTLQTSKTKETLIISKAPPTTPRRTLADIAGRWAIASILHLGLDFTLCTIYGSVFDDP